MPNAPVTIKLNLEINVSGDGTVSIDQNGTDVTAATHAADFSEWDPTTAGGIRAFNVFAGVGSEQIGHVVVVQNTNPPAGFTSGQDHWLWSGATWVDCFRMESAGTLVGILPTIANFAADLFPVNQFTQETKVLPTSIPSTQRLWQAQRRNANGTTTDLQIFLHKYDDTAGKLHLDFYAAASEINTSNYLIWSPTLAYFWNRRFSPPVNTTAFRTVSAVKSN